jgi:hypothetical protein
MDVTNLITQDNAETGVWARVELYGQKQDFELNILGDDSDAVQKFNRAQAKKMRLTGGKSRIDDEAFDAVFELSEEGVLVRIAGIRGLQFDKKRKEAIGYEPVMLEGKESYRLLIEKIPAIKDFVLKISGDRTNFLSGRPGA